MTPLQRLLVEQGPELRAATRRMVEVAERLDAASTALWRACVAARYATDIVIPNSDAETSGNSSVE